LSGLDASDVRRLVRDARKRAGLTQSELAFLVQTSQTAISRLERGLGWPNLFTLVTVLDAAGAELVLQARPDGDALERSLSRVAPLRRPPRVKRLSGQVAIELADIAEEIEDGQTDVANTAPITGEMGRNFPD
jgi:transcriptional regulator with XRE-family HTH domain